MINPSLPQGFNDTSSCETLPDSVIGRCYPLCRVIKCPCCCLNPLCFDKSQERNATKDACAWHGYITGEKWFKLLTVFNFSEKFQALPVRIQAVYLMEVGAVKKNLSQFPRVLSGKLSSMYFMVSGIDN